MRTRDYSPADRLIMNLDQALRTLAGRMASAGYRTAAVSGNPHVRPEFGFGQGFERFESTAGWGPWKSKKSGNRSSCPPPGFFSSAAWPMNRAARPAISTVLRYT